MYPELTLYIDGKWCDGSDGVTESVVNPADGTVLGELPHANLADLDRALSAAEQGFTRWRQTLPYERAAVLGKAALLLEQRSAEIAEVLTLEQGKPLNEAKLEMARVVETFAWYAEQTTRVHSKLYAARGSQFRQSAVPEPVGVVAAFTAWNFPAVLPARKLAPALAAGCSVLLKAAEETPATAILMAHALADSGLPAGVLNLVFGEPATVSQHVLDSPVVRKLTFTGSVPVGKQLARLAANRLQRVTLELGGHAPTIICADADIDAAVTQAAAFKFRNAGQVCIAPSRFYVHRSHYQEVLQRFAAYANSLHIGNGMSDDVDMGPMANPRRITAMQGFVENALDTGAQLITGGKALDGPGYFFTPTVLADVSDDAKIMQQEPFGPIAPFQPFDNLEEVLSRANALPYGLAAYAFCGCEQTAHYLATSLQAGSVGINTMVPAQAETPMGGVKESGYGYEGGEEGLEAFYHRKLVTHGC